MTIKHEYLECQCTSLAHLIRISLDIDSTGLDDPTFYINVQLNPYRTWYQRVYHGTRYILGFSEASRSTDWSETLLDPEGVATLHKMLTTFSLLRALRASRRKRRK